MTNSRINNIRQSALRDRLIWQTLSSCLILAFLLSACEKVEDNAIVPNSLPYSLKEILPSGPESYSVDFDSVTKNDNIIWSHLGERGTIQSGEGGLMAYGQKDFEGVQRSGLERVSIRGADFPVGAEGRKSALVLLNYKDSVCLELLPYLKLTPEFVHRNLGPRQNGMDLDLLARWAPPGHSPLIVLLKSHRTDTRPLIDTILFYDPFADKIVNRYVAGASFHMLQNTLDQSPILVLYTNDYGWSLSADGMDDSHRYLVGFRPDGTVAWKDTLVGGHGFKSRGKSLSASGGAAVFSFYCNNDESRVDSGVLMLHDRITGRQRARRILPFPIIDIRIHIIDRMEQYIAVGEFGELLVLDSSLQPIVQKNFGVGFDWGHMLAIVATDEGTPQVDINGDGVPDFFLYTAKGQGVFIDGKTYDPLAATPALREEIRLTFVRSAGNPVRILSWTPTRTRTSEIIPTPMFDRVWVHGRMIGIVVAPSIIVFLVLYLKLRQRQRETRIANRRLTIAHVIAHSTANRLQTILSEIDGAFLLGSIDNASPESKKRVHEKLKKNILFAKQNMAELEAADVLQEGKRLPSNLHDVVADWMNGSQVIYQLEDVDIRNEIPRDVALVRLDVRQFGQLLGCAIDNAVQAMPGHQSKRSVVIRAEEVSDHITIIIEDNGKGMPESALDRARSGESFTTKPAGTGLGLGIIRRIAKEHGADVSIESIEDIGTKLVIRFTINR